METFIWIGLLTLIVIGGMYLGFRHTNKWKLLFSILLMVGGIVLDVIAFYYDLIPLLIISIPCKAVALYHLFTIK